MTKKQFDVAVVGGGMVGAATALGLARQGKRVAVVEGFSPKTFDANQELDIRISAISRASVELLKNSRCGTQSNLCECIPILFWKLGSGKASTPASMLRILSSITWALW